MEEGDKVEVTGPKGSAQFGQTGEVVSVGEKGIVTVKMEDGRTRNYKPTDLKRVE